MRLGHSELNKAFGISEAYNGWGSKQKTLSNCEMAKTIRTCENENSWWKHEKVRDTMKHLCHHNLMPISQVAHVMKCYICLVGHSFQIAFLSSYSFSKMSIVHSFSFHSCHSFDNRKLIENMYQLKGLSAFKALTFETFFHNL